MLEIIDLKTLKINEKQQQNTQPAVLLLLSSPAG